LEDKKSGEAHFFLGSIFARIVERYGGDIRIQSLSRPEQFRAMAYAQLTYRKSQRDIENCLMATPRS
jgi:hypothetical protein